MKYGKPVLIDLSEHPGGLGGAANCDPNGSHASGDCVSMGESAAGNCCTGNDGNSLT